LHNAEGLGGLEGGRVGGKETNERVGEDIEKIGREGRGVTVVDRYM
jgi:hypothetical protein